MRPIALAAAVLLASATARADIAVSSNDNHTVLDNGNQVAPRDAKPDTFSVIDLSRYPPSVAATAEAPGSVVGPPMAVWVSPDESWGIVTSATKADPAGKFGISPDDRVSVIDLKSTPPKIVQSLSSGAGATVVRVSPDGRLALIANRTEGTVSAFEVADHRLGSQKKLDLGNPKAGPSGIAFLKDGRTALVSRDGDNMVGVLHIDGANVTLDPRPISTGLRPYTLDINPASTLAAVINAGRGDGDADTVALIDLTLTPFRTVSYATIPNGPEGLKFSPDGRFLAVGSQDGTTKAPGNVFRKEHGTLVVFAVKEKSLVPVAEAPIGHWSQGIAFSRDGATMLVQDMVEQQLRVFRWDGNRLEEGAPLAIGAGPAAIRTSWP